MIKENASNNKKQIEEIASEPVDPYIDDEDKEKQVSEAIELFERNKIDASVVEVVVESKAEFAADGEDIEHNEAERPSKKTKRADAPYPLPKGTKVIAPQPKNIAARKEALKRDQARFGKEHVLEKPEDCKGRIEKNKNLGKKLDRDLCIE